MHTQEQSRMVKFARSGIEETTELRNTPEAMAKVAFVYSSYVFRHDASTMRRSASSASISSCVRLLMVEL